MTDKIDQSSDRQTDLYVKIAELVIEVRQQVRASVNQAMVLAYWQIGQWIVENEQNGETQAAYGKALINRLSAQLTEQFGKGFDTSNLRHMRRFYLTFPIRDALRPDLTWTHYRLLTRVKSESARQWYTSEAADQLWSTRALERQINSFYYERLLSSQNKDLVNAEAEQAIQKLAPQDVLKDPYVMEFLDLKERESFTESELESALIENLQAFLLELGKGFSFVGRQRRITLDGEHFYIDLVFYNYLLKCFVLIDLKLGKLTHQDIGQMDTYVRLYEEKWRNKDDNPTIGLILCSEKNEAVAKYSVLADGKQLFASKYRLVLPTEEELAQELKTLEAEFEQQL